MAHFFKVPRHAVCCVVLNLQKQVGTRYGSFALAKAYRGTSRNIGSPKTGVGPKPVLLHHEHSRVFILYHKRGLLGRQNFST